jgi:hypothetical protein
MRYFGPIYLTATLAGTLGVYSFAPLARPFMAELFPAKETSTQDALPAQPPLPAPPKEESTTAARTEWTPPVEVQESIVVFNEAQPGEPVRTPASLGIRLASRGDVRPSWGIVCKPAEYFMMDGLLTGRLEAGKRIDYRTTQYASQGAMVEFMFDNPRGVPTTPYLISQTNLYLFTGSYKGLTVRQMQELQTYYELNEAAAFSESRQAPPPPKDVQLVLRGDVTPGWGVVRQQSNYYMTDGRRAGLLAAGTLIDYQRAVSSSKGAMVDGLICSTDQGPSIRGLIDQKDLHLFTGSYKDLSAKRVKDLRAYYELVGKIALRRKELLQASAEKNPFFPAYQATYQVLAAHIEKSRIEVLRRDHLAGADKVQAQARLYEMRMEERRLLMGYEEIQQKFKDWKKEHADELQAPEDDGEIRLCTKQKDTLAPDLPGLAY